MRDRAKASELAKKEQLQRDLLQLQLDRQDAELLLSEQLRLGELERSSIEAVKQELEARIALKQELQARITQRSAMLSALQAQPAWFNYAAAFAGSVVSTLIMHPLDTLKTRAVASGGGTAKGGGGDGGDDDSDDAAIQRGTVPTIQMTVATMPVSEPEEAAVQQPVEEEVQTAVKEAAEVDAVKETAAGAEAKLEAEAEGEGWSVKGYLSLYKGIDGALVKEGPPSALYLGIYEIMKSYLLTTTTLDPLAIYLISGALHPSHKIRGCNPCSEAATTRARCARRVRRLGRPRAR